MKDLFKQILKFLKSRLFRNIIFWVLVLLQVDDSATKYAYSPEWYYLFIFITTGMVAVLTYVNNLILIPKFLAKGQYAVYIPIIFSFVFLFTLAYTGVLKEIRLHFPKMNLRQVSLFKLPANNDLTGVDFSMATTTFLSYFGGWIIVFTMIWYINDHSKKDKEIADAKKRQTETELNFLKSQLNPHFLFNTLNNLYGLALKNSDKTPDTILKLSSILRYLLYESNTALVSFDKEKEIMQAYIDLELLRLSNASNMSFEISADKTYQIPPLLWLAVLENVFKHSTRVITDQPFIDYRFIIEQDILTIYSKNNCKTNTQKNEHDEPGGIGLYNLRKRLYILFPGRHTISTKDENNFYTTEIKIELI